MFYKVCEYCGANIDWSERCSCRDQEPADDPPQKRESRRKSEPVRRSKRQQIGRG